MGQPPEALRKGDSSMKTKVPMLQTAYGVMHNFSACNKMNHAYMAKHVYNEPKESIKSAPLLIYSSVWITELQKCQIKRKAMSSILECHCGTFYTQSIVFSYFGSVFDDFEINFVKEVCFFPF